MSTQREGHRRQRRAVANTFTAGATAGVESLGAAQMRKVLEWVDGAEAFDAFFGFRMLNLDILGELSLGEVRHSMQLATRAMPAFLVDLDRHFLKSFVTWNVPFLLPVAGWVPVKSWQRFVGSSRGMHECTCGAFQRYVARKGRELVGERRDLLRDVLASEAMRGTDPRSDEAIAAVLGSILEGGTDTRSNVLTFTMWGLSPRPEWQRRLREEFEEEKVVFEGGVAPYEQIGDLRVLDAVVQEGLRMFHAAVGSLPSVVPKGGLEMGGVWVLGGVSLSEAEYLAWKAIQSALVMNF